MKYFGSNNFLRDIFFIAGLLCVTWMCVYDLSEFTSLPKGIHFWKQSMQFSIIKNYYQHNSPFLYPEIDNLFNSDNTGHLVQEFPILHYISSLFFKLYPFNIRIINFFILFIGLFYLYRYIYWSTNNYFISFIIPLNTFLIPIVFYYGMSYITDISALFIGGMSIYLYEKYISGKKNKQVYFYVSWLFFTLSGLIRLPVIIFSLSYFIIRFLNKENAKKNIMGLLISLSVIVLWHLYVFRYNHYYISTPSELFILKISVEQRQPIWDAINNFMKYQLGYSNSFVFYYFILFIVLAFMVKKINKLVLLITLLSIFFSAIYIILWFGIFKDHDYYFIPIIPVFPLLWTLLYFSLKRIHFVLMYVVFSIMTLINLSYTVNNIRWKIFQPRMNIPIHLMSNYEEGIHWWNEQEDIHKWSTLRKISPFNNSDILLKKGFNANDTAICVFDASPTYALTILNLKGWSNYNVNTHNFDDIKSKVKAGAKFLITYGKESITNDTKQDSVLKQNLVLSVDSVYFYDISHLRY